MRASAKKLLALLEADGFVVAHDGERLLVAPRERLTDVLRAEIRERREYLFALLRERAIGFATPPGACPSCGYRGFYERANGTWGCARCFRSAARHSPVIYLAPLRDLEVQRMQQESARAEEKVVCGVAGDDLAGAGADRARPDR